MGFWVIIGVILGALLAYLNFKNKRKREDERLKKVIKSAIEESNHKDTKND